MGQVLIRDLDDGLLNEFRRSAASNGRSLEAELREALAQSRPRIAPLVDDALRDVVRSLWKATPPGAAQIDSTPDIRSARDGE